MVSRKIWIPSKQIFLRFRELSVVQYKDFYKCVEDDEDFILYLNDIIQSNSMLDISLSDLTIIDRFVIFLYLKIYSCGKDLKFTKDCEKCGTSTSKLFDLNESLDRLAPVIDKKFTMSFDTGTHITICDIPSVSYFDSTILARENIDDQIDNYLFGYIDSILINKNKLYLSKIEQYKRKEIFQLIRYKDLLQIKTDFVDVIYKSFSDLSLMNMHCTKCNEELFNLNFNTGNITDVIKILYNDDSLENILAVMSDLSTQCHFDHKFYENITPLEANIIYSRVSKSQQTSEQAHGNSQSTDLFDDYRSESKGMVEQPSEFR